MRRAAFALVLLLLLGGLQVLFVAFAQGRQSTHIWTRYVLEAWHWRTRASRRQMLCHNILHERHDVFVVDEIAHFYDRRRNKVVTDGVRTKGIKHRRKQVVVDDVTMVSFVIH